MVRSNTRLRTAFTLSAAAMVALLIGIGVARVTNAAAAAPLQAAFRVKQSTTPTYLQPGSTTGTIETSVEGNAPVLVIQAESVGGVGVPAGAEIVDTLPAGLTVASEPELKYVSEETGFYAATKCSFGLQIATCTSPAEVPVGKLLEVYVPLEVGANLNEVVTNSVRVTALETTTVESSLSIRVGGGAPPFGFVEGVDGLRGGAVDYGGDPPPAGSHPNILTLSADLPTKRTSVVLPVEKVRALGFDLPNGVVVNPLATPRRCGRIEFEQEEICPVQSQVGQLLIYQFGGFFIPAALYNLVPNPGVPAELGFGLFGVRASMRGHLTGEFRLGAEATEILAEKNVTGISVELWGDPSKPVHDRLRQGSEGKSERTCHDPFGCSVKAATEPFLTMPSSCSDGLAFSSKVSSWLGSGEEAQRLFLSAAGATEAVSECQRLPFNPEVRVSSMTASSSTASGLEFDLKVPQEENSSGLASSTVRSVHVRLPDGVAVNPSAVDGLASCATAQIGLGNTAAAACPEASRVGTATISTPLLETPLTGGIFLAEQGRNPFGSLLAIYLAVEGDGVVIKLPGRIDLDQATGQITASFDDLPQLPFETVHAQFNGSSGSPRAILSSPRACGTYSIQTELTPWSGTAPVTVSSPYVVNQNCVSGFSPQLSAGTSNPVGGAYSPFILRVTRLAGEQNLSAISATLPEGLLAKLAGVSLCSNAQAAAGACPADSKVGTTTVGVGTSQPLYLPQPGKAPTAIYLAGAYRGAPYSLVIDVPAQAGPFDLGNVVVRAALRVDPFTAQVTAASDPLPQILQGIPISYRDVRVEVNRPSFVVNPTDCTPSRIASTVVSDAGSIARPSERFQAAGCARLGFKPKLSLKLTGSTRRGGNPALRATLEMPKGGANISSVSVILPKSEFIDNRHINSPCTRPQFGEGKCPPKSILGRATAYTPLLDRPLSGPVYFRSNGGERELPDLVADLDGQVHLDVVGFVDAVHKKEVSRVRNRFATVPDAPVSKFVLRLLGGSKGLLQNSANLCRARKPATVKLVAQNGKVSKQRVKIAVPCGGAKKGKR